MFSRTYSRFIWEISSHAGINARKQLVHKYPPLSTAMYSFVLLRELKHYIVNERHLTIRTAVSSLRVRRLCITALDVQQRPTLRGNERTGEEGGGERAREREGREREERARRGEREKRDRHTCTERETDRQAGRLRDRKRERERERERETERQRARHRERDRVTGK